MHWCCSYCHQFPNKTLGYTAVKLSPQHQCDSHTFTFWFSGWTRMAVPFSSLSLLISEKPVLCSWCCWTLFSLIFSLMWQLYLLIPRTVSLTLLIICLLLGSCNYRPAASPCLPLHGEGKEHMEHLNQLAPIMKVPATVSFSCGHFFFFKKRDAFVFWTEIL